MFCTQATRLGNPDAYWSTGYVAQVGGGHFAARGCRKADEICGHGEADGRLWDSSSDQQAVRQGMHVHAHQLIQRVDSLGMHYRPGLGIQSECPRAKICG